MTGQEVGCRTGWLLSGNQCYSTRLEKKPFDEARAECANILNGGRLAEIRDSDSMNGVSQSIKLANIASIDQPF